MMWLPRAVPGSIWALGVVSLLMDVSSEMIHALLPVFMVTVLGASAVAVGLIEGIAEATAAIVKVFSGVVSDRLGKRKLLAALGYGLGAASKPLFALAPSLGWVLAARFTDRIGKGIRGAPRDALVAELAPPAMRGACFGLRQSLDTVGAFLGPLLAVAVMLASGGDFRLVFALAVIPGLLSVAVLVAAVREPPRPAAVAAVPIRWRALGGLGAAYWAVLGAAAVFTLARFSEAFLVLRVQGLGLGAAWVPLVLVAMNVVYALSAYPAGSLSDRLGRRGLLAASLAVLVLADAVLAVAAEPGVALAGVALWGLHMGLSQGLLASLVADTAPAALRGSAFGLFHLASGLCLLAASVLAGTVWEMFGPAATFLTGAGFALAAVLALKAVPAARP
ncbi:MAG: MFS transporter [Magnetospirillum sp.]|nr:MFS transporter [Magnetospirillum sp.]